MHEKDEEPPPVKVAALGWLRSRMIALSEQLVEQLAEGEGGIGSRCGCHDDDAVTVIALLVGETT